MSFFTFKLIGSMALLMHSDDIDQGDQLQEWRRDPKNKDISVKGDDRSPAWTWMTYLYRDSEHISMPSPNIMGALCKAGMQITLKGRKTYKELTQSGLFMPDEFCKFFVDGRQIPMESIVALRNLSFAEQAQAVKEFGFTLFSKRAAIGKAKHIRVRARFNPWSVEGRIQILDDKITPGVLRQLFEISGSVAGLGDWRPSSRAPGPYGQFKAILEREK